MQTFTTRQITLRPRCALPSTPSRRQAMRPIVNVTEEDRATDIGNVYKKFGNDRICGSGDILADTQTHRETDMLITILATAPAGEVKMHGTIPQNERKN